MYDVLQEKGDIVQASAATVQSLRVYNSSTQPASSIYTTDGFLDDTVFIVAPSGLVSDFGDEVVISLAYRQALVQMERRTTP